MAQQYSAVPESATFTNSSPPEGSERKRSLSLSGSDSDMSYRDPMDIEPFDEKGHTTVLNDDEAEEGLGYAIEPRRVSCDTLAREPHER